MDRYPEHPSHLGEHLKKRRYDLKMSVQKCQRILGVDKSTVADWERGRHKPTPEHIAKIIEFLGYTPGVDF